MNQIRPGHNVTKIFCETARDEFKSLNKFNQEETVEKDDFLQILLLTIFCKYETYLLHMSAENFLSMLES